MTVSGVPSILSPCPFCLIGIQDVPHMVGNGRRKTSRGEDLYLAQRCLPCSLHVILGAFSLHQLCAVGSFPVVLCCKPFQLSARNCLQDEAESESSVPDATAANSKDQKGSPLPRRVPWEFDPSDTSSRGVQHVLFSVTNPIRDFLL